MPKELAYNWGLGLIFAAALAVFLVDAKAQRRRRLAPAGEASLLDDLFKHRGAVESLLFAVAFILFYLFNNHSFNLYNNYAYLAEALLNGRLDVPDMPAYLESVAFGGYKYMHFAPGPALLCLPFVALFGVAGTNCAYLCFALGAANAVLFYKTLENLQVGDARERLWFSAFAVLGTVHFFCAALGDSWFLGHVSTLFFLFLAFYFVTLPPAVHLARNTFFAGLFFGLAVTCRMPALLGGVFFAGYLWLNRKERLRAFLLFAAGAAVFGGLFMLYNYARYGTVMDLGYNLTYLKDKHREAYNLLQAAEPSAQLAMLYDLQAQYGGPLQWQYARYNLYSIFLMPPEFSSAYPYLIPTVAGVAVTFTSPGLYFGVAAPWRKPLTWILWIAVIATAFPFLLNYGNGMAQFGMRYSLDFTPYLLLLACMGLTPLRPWKKALLLLCMAVNAWGPLYWNCFYR